MALKFEFTCDHACCQATFVVRVKNWYDTFATLVEQAEFNEWKLVFVQDIENRGVHTTVDKAYCPEHNK